MLFLGVNLKTRRNTRNHGINYQLKTYLQMLASEVGKNIGNAERNLVCFLIFCGCNENSYVKSGSSDRRYQI